MSSALPDPLLFIGGAPRSGTTLVRNMLTAHPLVAVPDESYFLYHVMAELDSTGRFHDLEHAWSLTRSDPFYSNWHLDEQHVHEVAAQHPPRSFPDLLRVLYAAYGRQTGKPWTADKTPLNARHFSLLAEMFPTSRFVHVVRDPRSVCMSAALQHWQVGGFIGAAFVWRNLARAVRLAADRLGDRLLELRYEHLVADPNSQLRRLCRHAGVPFDAEMLQYHRGATVVDNHHARAGEPLQPNGRRWWEELSRRDVALVERITGSEMAALGYARVSGVRRVGVAPSVVAYMGRRALEARVSRRCGLTPPRVPRRLATSLGPLRPFPVTLLAQYQDRRGPDSSGLRVAGDSSTRARRGR